MESGRNHVTQKPHGGLCNTVSLTASLKRDAKNYRSYISYTGTVTQNENDWRLRMLNFVIPILASVFFVFSLVEAINARISGKRHWWWVIASGVSLALTCISYTLIPYMTP